MTVTVWSLTVAVSSAAGAVRPSSILNRIGSRSVSVSSTRQASRAARPRRSRLRRRLPLRRFREQLVETAKRDRAIQVTVTETQRDWIEHLESLGLEKRMATQEDRAGCLLGDMDRLWDNREAQRERLAELLEAQTRIPAGFHPHPKIMRGMEMRREMAHGARPLDWSAAESLAFATLATGNIRVRLTGQDTARGTFSQRHAVLRDYETGRPYVPLNHLLPKQAPVEIHNSPLSEAGALGYEYGYSLDCPDGLVLWEAQFGDFSNAAQVIIDQFITSAEEKWHRLSGLVLLLPHGFEGMGPEHSSARVERFLQLGANDNIQVVYPTTPAQYFHCLRRQALRKWRKPLVILTPKSLLRHPQAISSLEQCAAGSFQPVLGDDRPASDQTEQVILCSGKIYYDLQRKRQELKRDRIAVVRVEQLYPFPEKQLRSVLQSYPRRAPVVWAQEEPENMGAWCYLNLKFQGELFDGHPFSVVCRQRSASPATGSARAHKEEQEEIVTRALER